MCGSHIILPWLEKTRPWVLKCWRSKILTHNSCFKFGITVWRMENKEASESSTSSGITKSMCRIGVGNLTTLSSSSVVEWSFPTIGKKSSSSTNLRGSWQVLTAGNYWSKWSKKERQKEAPYQDMEQCISVDLHVLVNRCSNL